MAFPLRERSTRPAVREVEVGLPLSVFVDLPATLDRPAVVTDSTRASRLDRFDASTGALIGRSEIVDGKLSEATSVVVEGETKTVTTVIADNLAVDEKHIVTFERCVACLGSDPEGWRVVREERVNRAPLFMGGDTVRYEWDDRARTRTRIADRRVTVFTVHTDRTVEKLEPFGAGTQPSLRFESAT